MSIYLDPIDYTRFILTVTRVCFLPSLAAETTACFPPDVTEQLEDAVTFDGKEMQWYSVWGRQEMELEELPISFDVEPPPLTALLLCVSEAAAGVVERGLFKLCAEHRHLAETGERPLRSASSHFSVAQLIVFIAFDFYREVQPLHPADSQRSPGWDRRHRVSFSPGAELPQKF